MATVKLNKLIPVMLCFFAMGFVDLVGIASNYVKADLGLSDSPGILLVPDILSPDRNPDEPHRPQEDCIAEPCCDIRIAAASYIRRQLYAHALLFLPVGNRQRADADFA